MEKTHKQVVNTLVLELKKEKSEKTSLEDKNNALRKRLQKMLIECDEVRVKASTEVAAVKENAKRITQQLEKALAAAKAQLRLQDRGPNVTRTDSIVNDLVACKAQLDRMKRVEADRSAQLSARFNMENRHADREAHRVREKLISLFRSQLRQVGKRGGANPAPASSSAAAVGAAARVKAESAQTVAVMYEGIRRLSFLKLFGFPHDFDQYTSPEFYSLAQIHRSLEHDEFADLFGSSLSHEERTGFFIVAVAPMVSWTAFVFTFCCCVHRMETICFFHACPHTSDSFVLTPYVFLLSSFAGRGIRPEHGTPEPRVRLDGAEHDPRARA